MISKLLNEIKQESGIRFPLNDENLFKDLLDEIESNKSTLESLVKMPFFWSSAKILAVICTIATLSFDDAIQLFKEYDVIQSDPQKRVFKGNWIKRFTQDQKDILLKYSSAVKPDDLRRRGMQGHSRQSSPGSYYSNNSPRYSSKSHKRSHSNDRNSNYSSTKRRRTDSSGSYSSSSTCSNQSNPSVFQFNYDCSKLGMLMKFIRNLTTHYEQKSTPQEVKDIFGAKPERLLQFFTHNFPNLVHSIYYALKKCDCLENVKVLVGINKG
jgi:Ribonuclease 2-5A